MTARRRAGRTSALFVALGLMVIGFGGAYSYWESYYQHRGFQTVALVAGAHQGRLVGVNFYSRALGRKADYLAYLPPGYAPARRRYPVYYLLHGSPGRPEVYVTIANMGLRMDDLVARHRMQPMIWGRVLERVLRCHRSDGLPRAQPRLGEGQRGREGSPRPGPAQGDGPMAVTDRVLHR